MDVAKDVGAASEPAEIKLHLGDRKLERWVEELKAAPPKLSALKDAVVGGGEGLNRHPLSEP